VEVSKPLVGSKKTKNFQLKKGQWLSKVHMAKKEFGGECLSSLIGRCQCWYLVL